MHLLFKSRILLAILLTGSVFQLSSCGVADWKSNDDDPAGISVQQMFKAEKYTIEYRDNPDTAAKSNIVAYTLYNVPVPSNKYEPDNTLSGIALALFRAMPDSTKKKYDYVKVKISNKARTDSAMFEKETLGSPSLLESKVEDFISQIHNRGLPGLDDRFFPDSSRAEAKKILAIKFPYKDSCTALIRGFSWSSNFIPGEPVILYETEITQKKLTRELIFLVSTKSEKIIGLRWL